MNETQLSQVIDACGKDVLRFCRITAGSAEAGDDLYQDTMLTLLEKQERTRLVHEALTALQAEDREIFLRYYYYNQSVSQISEALGRNTNTVKSRLARGRSKLKEILMKEGFVCEA